ncbi:MAG TPA: glycogen debranching protein GlgX [Actinomycetota bacterium]|nr:glycogen debranching protein GlgX [Actinomycetota bacterium]
MKGRPGDPRVLGATWDGAGVDFSVFSSCGAYGGDVTLCLVAGDGTEERLPTWPENDVWSCRVDGVGPGQRYGYRVTGPFLPDQGVLFDSGTLLLDPYARVMSPGAAPRALECLVTDVSFDWGDDRRPDRAWADTVLYEVHVKGISARHPGVPEQQRGTYAGLASDPVIEHLTTLGVTAVELLPVHQFLTEQFLLDRGLTNYWGYSTIGFFAPHAAYSSSGVRGEQVTEFKQMVRALHAAGIEVILDVVFNHTAEGPADAPALSFRGLANDVYYRSDPNAPGRYVDTTGTGNSLDAERPEVLRLVLDSLRYWVEEMHVDGFRFDLAATLARYRGMVDAMAPFFALLYQDPVLSNAKLIAEPWDVNAPDSYQVGRFPRGWAEWNDRYRDDVRDYWRGAAGPASMGYRLTGSSDLYGATRRGPDASVNFVTAHDGKTLADLVTYEGKYNEANGEDNRDGTGADRAENYGVEGPTDDPTILATRTRQQRNMLATLLLSQGVTMICGGDEIGRTQQGNNNAYCQDNEISWYDWELDDGQRALLAFTARAIALQREHPALRRRKFLTGRGPGDRADVSWYDAGGREMTPAQWSDPSNGFLAFVLAGDAIDDVDETGEPLRDEDVLVVMNASPVPMECTVPGRPGATYGVALDTARADGAGDPAQLKPGDVVTVGARTLWCAIAPIPS